MMRSGARGQWVMVAITAAATASASWERGATAAPFPPSRAEEEAVESLDGGHLTRARSQAEAVLAERPDAVVARYVLACVFRRQEANLARSLHLLRSARATLEEFQGLPPSLAEARSWHRKLLVQEANVLGEMDRNEEKLAVMDLHDRHHPPDEAERIWPLMKLRRFDEAIATARRLTNHDDPDELSEAYNGLLAIASEMGDRRASWEWGIEGFERTGGRSCTIASNMANVALANLRYDEVEAWVKKAQDAKDQDCVRPPVHRLVGRHLLAGRFQEALSAFREVRRKGLDRAMTVQFEMSIRAALAEILYALGRPDEAARRAWYAVARPDRVGVTSGSSEAQFIANTLLYVAALSAWEEVDRERASVRPFIAALPYRLNALNRAAVEWARSRALIGVAARPGMLVRSVRPYLGDVTPWYAGALADVVGTGVLRKALREARRLDEGTVPGLAAYYDAMEGEAAWRAGDSEEATRLARAAINALPEESRMMRWRVEAYLADLLVEEGDLSGAAPLFSDVLAHHPTVLRNLRVRLPVRVISDGGEEAGTLARLLSDSPRFRIDAGADSPFEVHVSGSGDDISICLVATGGTRFNCTAGWRDEDAPHGAPPEDAERLARVADRFFLAAFSPRVDLTTADLHSLDGATGRGDADEAIRRVLGEDELEPGPGWDEEEEEEE